jgi:ABC-type branched-subunit amino acid transport system substrate-binding protein
MMRKMVPALAVGATLLTLSACGGSADSKASDSDGIKTGPGVSSKEIRVGVLSDYSGPLAEAATSGSLGMEVKFDEVNAAGGICGRKVVAVKEDTKYDPQQTTLVYRSSSKNMLMIGELLGTGSVTAIQDIIARDSMPSLAISMNTTTLKAKDVYVPLPVFEVELMNGVQWLAEQSHASADNPVKIGMFVGSDAYGKVYADAIQTAAKAFPGLTIVAKPTFTLSDKDYTAQATALQNAGADYVLLGGGPTETAGIIGASAQLGYKPTWVADSGAWFAALATPLKGLLDKFYVSAGYGTIDDDNAGITALKAAVAKYAPDAKPSNFQVAGWLFGDATVAALQKACDNKDLTREGVTKALDGLQVDYQGITPQGTTGDDKIASYSSRMNTVSAAGELVPQGDFYASDVAKEWGAANGM